MLVTYLFTLSNLIAKGQIILVIFIDDNIIFIL